MRESYQMQIVLDSKVRMKVRFIGVKWRDGTQEGSCIVLFVRWSSTQEAQPCSVDPAGWQQLCDSSSTLLSWSFSVFVSSSVSLLVSLSLCNVSDGTSNSLYSVTLPSKSRHSASYSCFASLRLFAFAFFIWVLWNLKQQSWGDTLYLSLFMRLLVIFHSTISLLKIHKRQKPTWTSKHLKSQALYQMKE